MDAFDRLGGDDDRRLGCIQQNKTSAVFRVDRAECFTDFLMKLQPFRLDAIISAGAGNLRLITAGAG